MVNAIKLRKIDVFNQIRGKKYDVDQVLEKTESGPEES